MRKWHLYARSQRVRRHSLTNDEDPGRSAYSEVGILAAEIHEDDFTVDDLTDDDDSEMDEDQGRDQDQSEGKMGEKKIQPNRGYGGRKWLLRLQQAAACLRGLQEGAVPEDRLDERSIRDILVQIEHSSNNNSVAEEGNPASGADGSAGEDDGEGNNEENMSSGSAPDVSDSEDEDDKTQAELKAEAVAAAMAGYAVGGAAVNTELHVACSKGAISTVLALLQEGRIHVNSRNALGETPLHCAARHLPLMFLPVVVHLLQSGASTTIEDNTGNTPLDVATNDVISLAMMLHRQRLENFEFTSHERCWYRSRSIQKWKHVNHRSLWREIVHLTVTRHRELKVVALEKALREEEASTSCSRGSSSRPGSRRSRSGSRSGAISASRMERIRRMQQGNREKNNMMSSNIETGGSVDSNTGSLEASGSVDSVGGGAKRLQQNPGWRSAARSCPKNTWTGRYHRALSFLRVRGARDAKGFANLLEQQEHKMARRVRRMGRRMTRDSLLISNAFLRESVAQYEKQAAIREAVEATQAKIRAGGSDPDDDDSDDSGEDENGSEHSQDEDGHNEGGDGEREDSDAGDSNEDEDSDDDLSDVEVQCDGERR